MKSTEKTLLRCYLSAVLATVLFVPWTDPMYHFVDYGYGLLFVQPENAVVNYGRVFLEIIALSCIAGLWLIKIRSSKNTNNTTSPTATKDKE
jgi:Na+-driven multidrug efflux pump